MLLERRARALAAEEQREGEAVVPRRHHVEAALLEHQSPLRGREQRAVRSVARIVEAPHLLEKPPDAEHPGVPVRHFVKQEKSLVGERVANVAQRRAQVRGSVQHVARHDEIERRPELGGRGRADVPYRELRDGVVLGQEAAEVLEEAGRHVGDEVAVVGGA